jgi:hypothetical protein
MELRPELTPPVLDETSIDRLAQLADRLDGAAEGQCDEELVEFNKLANTSLTLREFQGIYKAVAPEDFVRDLLYRRSVTQVPDLSRAEMVEIVSRLQTADEEHGFYLALFELYCKHPGGTDLIFYPDAILELSKDREPTAEEIADCALNWEPRVVAMQIAQRSGGTHVPYYLYNLEAPGVPTTQVVTEVGARYEKGAVVAVALKGVRLDDGTVVTLTFEFGPFSCGKILGPTDLPVGSRIQ